MGIRWLSISVVALTLLGAALAWTTRSAPHPDDLHEADTPRASSSPEPGLRGAATRPVHSDDALRSPEDAGVQAERPEQPTVRQVDLESPAGWIGKHDLGCKLVITSAPAWYGYDASLWQPGGRSLADSYPSEEFPALGDAACVATLTGRLTTHADARHLEAVLCVDGADVLDVAPGATGGNLIGFTGGPPEVRWNIPVSSDVLDLLADARWAEVRFRPRRLSRTEALSERRWIHHGDRKLTTREYVEQQRPPSPVAFSEAALAEFKRIRNLQSAR